MYYTLVVSFFYFGQRGVYSMKMSTLFQQKRYLTLVLAVSVSGVSQGLLMSLLAIILEKEGISSSLNSINALGLYVGMLLVTPFLEAPVRRFGYKPVILAGLGIVALSTILFPVWDALIFWMGLRFLVGIGDGLLHFATQTWIVSSSAAHERGKKISFYGFSYGIGFAVGPLGINLLEINLWAPFIALMLFYLFVLIFVIRLRNETPPREDQEKQKGTIVRYRQVLSLSWFAFLPAMLYGYLESSLNNNFPVYALKVGISQHEISILLPAFLVGGLLMQIPLGVWSDRIGRKQILMTVILLGGIGFALVPLFIDHVFGLMLLFIVIGGLVGSTFSLGLAYMADLLPLSLIPTGNILSTIVFGAGSLLGVYLNGLLIQYLGGAWIFYFLAAFYLGTAVLGFAFSQGRLQKQGDLA